jgi:hypothetical protein
MIIAHISGGQAFDPQPNDSVDEYKARYNEQVLALWVDHDFREVPAGTQHCAADNGDGTFTNPDGSIVPPPPEEPAP